ncbi:ornithine carbamoyltransferase [Methyloceanibacter caenitepidi]|uniref:Ornithine carbamoyltransferase n=1 Tax=Methyloceanibacter caenitepidi TaxID=1384459 RepID=A0A0A8K2T5_9HYPH|nr:ornithine carbamoyltransferase [Methyloceanibacter caenitepidi]
MPSTPSHFLDIDALDTRTLRAILDAAAALKKARKVPKGLAVPKGAVLAMIFEKPSTRTRVSFEMAMHQLGGAAIVLNAQDMQLGRGETIGDTARVLSRYVDAIMLRTGPHQGLLDFAAYADIPVINALTARSHPCQIMADVLTFEEHKGPIKGRVVAWIGDANNVATSWVHAAARFGFTVRIASPADFGPDQDLLAWARAEGAQIEVMEDARAAAKDADCIVTDTWVSMGDKDVAARKSALEPFRVDEALMALAKPDAIFMHCLPAHRGDEVTDAVMDGPQSVVWDEAENRLHAQKAILVWCLNKGRLPARAAAKKKPSRKAASAKRKLPAKKATAKKKAAASKNVAPKKTRTAKKSTAKKPAKKRAGKRGGKR